MAAPAPRIPRWTSAIVILCCVTEVALQLADLGGWPGLRHATVLYGAFWSQLMHGDPGLVAGQGLWMFASYGLLHAGFLHLAMNMVSLAAVARELRRLMPVGQMALAYGVSQIAAAGIYGWMEPMGGPMIGASGAVFGLAGALVGYATIWRLRTERPMRPVLRAVALVLGLNVALTLLMPQIAWQAHLGGAVAGLLIGLIAAHLRVSRVAMR